MDLNHIQDVAVKAAKSAAELILTANELPKVANYKSKADLVTKTDTESEQLICKMISENFPNHGILAEESGAHYPNSDYQWIIDPLDGTTNFVHNYPAFAISIGVYYKHKPMVACIIELPVYHIYTAVRNQRAYCDGSMISVSAVNELDKSLLVTGFGYNHDVLWERNMELFKRFTDTTQGVRRLGAAAVDLCHVACGKVDGFWEFDLKPWDTAAGILLVLEAGGKITQTNGSAFSIFDNQILASNALIHKEMMQIINS